jgi:hypothetical protein
VTALRASRSNLSAFEATASLDDLLAMRLLVLTLLFVFSGALPAGVYKWIDSDGRVHYTDQPAEGAEPVVVPGSAADEGNAPTQVEGREPDLGPYRVFEVVSPEANATIRDPQGAVPVGLVIEPPKIAGHRLLIELDGQLLSEELSGAQLRLQGLGFGSHVLRAVMYDELDVPVASTPSVDFHLRKPLPESALP